MNKSKSKDKKELEIVDMEVFSCVVCSEESPSIASLTTHMRSHIPNGGEKYGETILRALEEQGKPVDLEELMTLCHVQNPSASKHGEKAYKWYIKNLAKSDAPKNTIKTIVELL